MIVSALLVSALVHDTDHPGVMNTYLVATKHPAAVLRGETPTAVLEHHHAKIALTLLDRPELNFLEALAPEQRQRFKDLVHENVINTDVTTTMGAASSLQKRRPSISVDDFNGQVQRASDSGSRAKVDTKLVMCLIIKAADISNPARPLHVYKCWIDGVMTEFFTQGDAERQAGLPISMNCDRHTVLLPKCQVGLISPHAAAPSPTPHLSPSPSPSQR